MSDDTTNPETLLCDIVGCWSPADPDTGFCDRHGDNPPDDLQAIELIRVRIKYLLTSDDVTVNRGWSLVIGWPVGWPHERVSELAASLLVKQHSPSTVLILVIQVEPA